MELLLARQPIFDRDERVVAYALLHQRVGAASSDADPYAMAEHILLDATIGTGLERLADGRLAFVKVTPSMLLGDAVRHLDAQRVALEVRCDALSEQAVSARCGELAGHGFALVLDGFAEASDVAPLLPHAHAVKVDVRGRDEAALAQLAHRVRPHRARLLAEHAEHRGVRDLCLRLGYDLFQGVRFAQPEVLRPRELPTQHLRVFRLLKELRNPDLPDSEIEESFRRDVGLSYTLLRIVNAATTGARGVWSIGHAIRLLGREALHRWLTLLLLASVGGGGVRDELARQSLLRGRLCELLALEAGMRPASGPLFLVGSLSQLDALLETPMPELVGQLDLHGEIGDALVARAGFFGLVLALVEAHEAGLWDDAALLCEQVGVARGALSAHYLEAVGWAHERLGQAAASPAGRAGG